MEIGLYLVDGRRPADAARGHLALNGKASVKGTSNDSIFHLECLDVTGAQFLDDAIHRGDLVDSSLGLIAVHGSPVSFNVAFVCRDLASSGGAEEDIEWRDVRINAVKATTVTRVQF